MKRLGAGMVFLVDRNTEAECLRRRLGALPSGSRAVAARVAAGDLVFVFNTATKVRYTPRRGGNVCVAGRDGA